MWQWQWFSSSSLVLSFQWAVWSLRLPLAKRLSSFCREGKGVGVKKASSHLPLPQKEMRSLPFWWVAAPGRVPVSLSAQGAVAAVAARQWFEAGAQICGLRRAMVNPTSQQRVRGARAGARQSGRCYMRVDISVRCPPMTTAFIHFAHTDRSSSPCPGFRVLLHLQILW